MEIQALHWVRKEVKEWWWPLELTPPSHGSQTKKAELAILEEWRGWSILFQWLLKIITRIMQATLALIISNISPLSMELSTIAQQLQVPASKKRIIKLARMQPTIRCPPTSTARSLLTSNESARSSTEETAPCTTTPTRADSSLSTTFLTWTPNTSPTTRRPSKNGLTTR